MIDVWSNPAERAKKIETMIGFLQSDSVSYRSSQPPALVRLQEKHWDPIMAFMTKEFKCRLPISTIWTVRHCQHHVILRVLERTAVACALFDHNILAAPVLLRFIFNSAGRRREIRRGRVSACACVP